MALNRHWASGIAALCICSHGPSHEVCTTGQDKEQGRVESEWEVSERNVQASGFLPSSALCISVCHRELTKEQTLRIRSSTKNPFLQSGSVQLGGTRRWLGKTFCLAPRPLLAPRSRALEAFSEVEMYFPPFFRTQETKLF